MAAVALFYVVFVAAPIMTAHAALPMTTGNIHQQLDHDAGRSSQVGTMMQCMRHAL